MGDRDSSGWRWAYVAVRYRRILPKGSQSIDKSARSDATADLAQRRERWVQLVNDPPLTPEQNENYVLVLFSRSGRGVMVRAVVEEAATLASLALFLGMIAIWAQVIAAL